MGFWSTNIQQYYTVQQLIAQLSSTRVVIDDDVDS